MVATVANGDVERVARALGLETVSVAERGNPYRRSRELKRIMAAQHPDLIAVASESELLGAAWALRRDSRPVLLRRVATNEPLERHWRARLAERRATVAYLVATAGSVRPLIGGGDVVAAPMCVRVPAQPADTDDEITPRLVCAAGTTRTASLGELLRAFALLRERYPRLRLAVVGGAAGDPEVQLHAASLGVAEHVEWISDAVAREPAMRHGTIGCVVGHGDEEILGCLDLMASGIPFIALRKPETERYVAHGIHAVLLPALEPPRVAAELSVLLASPSRRAAMGMAARARVERDYSDRQVATVLEQAARRVRERARVPVGAGAGVGGTR